MRAGAQNRSSLDEKLGQEDSNLRRNLYCGGLTGLTKWLKHDLLHASLLEESLFLRSLALQGVARPCTAGTGIGSQWQCQ